MDGNGYSGGNLQETLVYEHDFSRGMEGWTVEGAAAAVIADNRLVIDTTITETPGATVWCGREFSGNMRFSYHAGILQPVLRSNMNAFVFFQDEALPPEALAERIKTADYGLYHEHSTYIFTYLTENDALRVRMRKCPGFNLTCENRPEGILDADKMYRFDIIHYEGWFSFRVNGAEVLSYQDKGVPQAVGRFGFRTWNTKMWWSDFKAYRLITAST